MFQLFSKNGRKKDFAIILNYPKTTSSFCKMIYIQNTDLFSLKRFVEYKYIGFLSGPQTPRRQINRFSGDTSSCTLRSQTSFKIHDVFITLEIQSHFLSKRTTGLLSSSPKTAIFNLWQINFLGVLRCY